MDMATSGCAPIVPRLVDNHPPDSSTTTCSECYTSSFAIPVKGTKDAHVFDAITGHSATKERAALIESSHNGSVLGEMGSHSRTVLTQIGLLCDSTVQNDIGLPQDAINLGEMLRNQALVVPPSPACSAPNVEAVPPTLVIPTTTTIASRKQWATKKDWICYETKLKRLYGDRNLSIAQIKDIMEKEHQFFAR